MTTQVSKWFQLIVLSTAVFLSVIDIFIVNVAIPSIKKGISGSDADIQMVIVLYLLGYSAFLITGGRLGDHYGKKRVFISAMVGFVIMSFLCGISSSVWQLNCSRFLQGASAALMIPQSISCIQFLFTKVPERTKAFGIYGSIAGTASVIGQFLGGFLPSIHFLVDGWRLIFLINLPVGILAILLAIKYLDDVVEIKNAKFDKSGVLLLTAALITFIYPLIQGPEVHWPLWCLVMIVTSFILLYFFIRGQRRKLASGIEPLIDMRLFQIKDFNIGLGAVLFYFMVQDSYFLINVILFQTGFGISASLTGIFFVFQGLGYVLASLLSLRLIPRYGKIVLQLGVLIMIIALAFHALYFTNPDISHHLLLPVMFIYGTGCGSVLPSLLGLALKNIPPHLAGVASGTFSTFQQTAIALGIGIVGGIFFYQLGGDSTITNYVFAYRTATLVNMLLLMVVSILLYLLPNHSDTMKVQSNDR